MKTKLLGLLAFVFSLGLFPANASTLYAYKVNFALSLGTVTGEIVTTCNSCTLDATNVVSWSFNINGHSIASNPGSVIQVSPPTPLIASPTGIDFSAGTSIPFYIVFQESLFNALTFQTYGPNMIYFECGFGLGCGSASFFYPFDLPIAKIFTAVAHDFNGDGKSDMFWRYISGDVAAWTMNGASIASGTALGNVPMSWSVVGQHDFDGDGKSDILWQDTSGNVAIWFMNGTSIASSALVANVPSPWTIAGIGDFDGDGMGDILWRNTNTGDVAIWLMNGASVTSSVFVATVPTSWSIVAVSCNKILWRDGSGNYAIWFMHGPSPAGSISLGNVPLSWSIVGTGDFNGDGNLDVLWRDTAGNIAIWLLSNSGTISSSIFRWQCADKLDDCRNWRLRR